MATKTHMVTCRLDDRDYESLHENAAALDVAPSTYMRYLIRIPVSACPDPKGSRVLVVDAKTLSACATSSSAGGAITTRASTPSTQ